MCTVHALQYASQGKDEVTTTTPFWRGIIQVVIPYLSIQKLLFFFLFFFFPLLQLVWFNDGVICKLL